MGEFKGRTSTAAKAAGREWENAVAAYLRIRGYPNAERRIKKGRNDQGDILGVGDRILECKAVRGWTTSLGAFCRQAAASAKNAGLTDWAIIIKRSQHQVHEGYVVLTLERYVELLWKADDLAA